VSIDPLSGRSPSSVSVDDDFADLTSSEWFAEMSKTFSELGLPKATNTEIIEFDRQLRSIDVNYNATVRQKFVSVFERSNQEELSLCYTLTYSRALFPQIEIISTFDSHHCGRKNVFTRLLQMIYDSRRIRASVRAITEKDNVGDEDDLRSIGFTNIFKLKLFEIRAVHPSERATIKPR
jgi:hypothetical protein